MWLCLLCFSTLTVAIADNACETNQTNQQFDATSKIRYIHDGDTLQLIDGRKIRLIGINTPELARDNKAAEPYAIEAKNALKSLFKNNKSIALIYGSNKKDRYGRTLAHTLLADGQNIQEILLEQGYATAIAIPPNTLLSPCYLEIEHKARCNKVGLWRDIKILQAKQLKNQHAGFHLVQGNVVNINTNKKGLWLNLDNKLSIGIRPENFPLFDIDAINKLVNQSIIVRGWLDKSNKHIPFYMRIRHPLSIQLTSSYACHQ